MRLSRSILVVVAALFLSGMIFAALPGSAVLAQGGTPPSLIVYSSNRSGNYEIYVLDPNTGLSTQLTNDPANDVEPDWASDGEQIAFASDRDGDYELFVVQVDGTDLKQLTNNQSQDRQPRWQPDDLQIVYMSDVNGQWDVYMITVEGGLVRQLTNDPGDERGPGAGVVQPVGPVATPQVITPVVVVPTTQATAVPDAIVDSTTLNVRENPGEGARIMLTVARGTPLKVLGRYQDNSWLQVLTPSNNTGWIYRPLVTVNIDLARVPVVNATFIAPPPTATPVPPTPSSTVNLVAGIVVLDPAAPTCQQTFTVGFDVANLGTTASAASGTVSLVDVRSADGSQQGTTIGGFPILQAGQTFRVNMPLTVSTWYGEQHTITLVIDPSNGIAETVETDNIRTVTYTLAKGSCP
ncbi:MAG: PD40 domain-containing protein [Chloroflexi bacterium]|nr:PD40 domain-containing protein [Chloroflexota bacterium]